MKRNTPTFVTSITTHLLNVDTQTLTIKLKKAPSDQIVLDAKKTHTLKKKI